MLRIDFLCTLILAITPTAAFADGHELPAPRPAMELLSSEIIPVADGEIALKQTVIVDADLASVWELFTNASQIRRWMAPVAEVELRAGGAIRTHYDSCASVGDPGTIELNIVNFVPQHLLTLQSNLASARKAAWMNDSIYERRDLLYNVIEFDSMADGKTRIVSWGLGYRDDPEWQTMLDFFVTGNEWSYGQLQMALAGKKVWPDCTNQIAPGH